MSSIQYVLINAVKTLTPTTDSAPLDAEVLLSEAMNQERSYLRAWPEKTLTPEQISAFNALIEQRQKGVPVAYILGRREFWSREFIVNKHVLIPRPDTELIIELCLKRIPRNTALKIIDLGTGSGIIAITLAAERPEIEVIACDSQEAALDVAKLNATKHHVARIKFIQSNWFEALPVAKVDFIISNPPYIAENDQHLVQGDLRFEPRTALASAKDGLQDIEIIIEKARDHLNPNGCLIIEHGYTQAPQVRSLFKQLNYQQIETFLDLAGNPRVTCGQLLNDNPEKTATYSEDNLNTNQAITIPRKLMQQLLQAAQTTPDLEVCGLISAVDTVPYRCYPIQNVAAEPKIRFQLDAKQQIAAITRLREQGESLFGIYHSHPTSPAVPSKTDVQLAAYPEALHFIISLDTKGVLALRCFKITHSLTQEIALSITD